MEARVAAGHPQRSYSDHDTQKRGAAGTGWNGLDDGSASGEFRLHVP